MNTTDRVEDLHDKFNDFLDTEMTLGISDKKTIERVKWYYETYFKKLQSLPTIQLEEGELEKVALKLGWESVKLKEFLKGDITYQDISAYGFKDGYIQGYKAAYQQRSAGKVLEIDWDSLGELNLSADEVERFKKIVLEEQTQVQFIPKFSLKDIEDAFDAGILFTKNGSYTLSKEGATTLPFNPTKEQFIENLLNKK